MCVACEACDCSTEGFTTCVEDQRRCRVSECSFLCRKKYISSPCAIPDGLFSFVRLTPTESKKERREYELGLVWAAMGKINQKDKDEGTRQFLSLQWRDEVRIASKCRKIEDEREQELLHKKKDAIRSMKEDDNEGSEAEEDETKEPEVPVSPLPKPP